MFSMYYRERKSEIVFRILKKHSKRWDAIKTLSRFCTWETIQKNPEINWDFAEASRNENITFDIIKNNPNETRSSIQQWNWMYFSMNKNLKWETIRDNPNEKWDWDEISQHPNMSWEIIKNNPGYNWNYDFVSMNPNITAKIVLENMEYEWGWSDVFRIKDWKFEMYEKHRDRIDDDEFSYMDVDCFSDISDISPEIIRNNNDIFWDYSQLSEKFDWEDMFNNPYGINKIKKRWVWSNCGKNPKIGWDIIKENLNVLDMSDVSANPNITFQIVKDNPKLKWDWDRLSINPAIKWKDVVNNPRETWNHKFLSQNPNVNLEIVEKYPRYNWDFSNTTELGENFDLMIKKEYLSTLKIKKWWVNLKNQ